MTMRIDGLATPIPPLPAVWHGRSLVVARAVWGILVALALLLFLVSVPADYHRLRYPPADIRAQLARAGLSPWLYAVYLTGVGLVFSLSCFGVATLIARHRSRDRVGLLASLYLVLIASTGAPAMQAVGDEYPALARIASFASVVLSLVLVAFFFLFPDGRFVPGWSRWPLLLMAVAAAVLFVMTRPSVDDPPGWTALMILGGVFAGIAAQLYRHARAASPGQRQQIRCVLLGAALANLAALADAFFGNLIPTIGRPATGYDLTGVTFVTLVSLALPLSIGFAVLRYRLWEIDVVVNRALVYGVLTVGLLALYLVIAEGIGSLVQDRGRLPLSLLATALIAVLFAPLRQRLQAAVNRLMYGDRDDPYRVLTQLGERLGAALAPDAAIAAVGETVAHALKSPHVALALDAGGPGVPATPESAAGELLRLPLEYQGERVGELMVAPRGPGEHFSATDRRLLADLARQIGPAAHAIRLAGDLQRARERLVTAREEERRRLRRDLHDGLGPQLAALTLKIETIRNRFVRERELDAMLVDLTQRTQDALADIRRLVYGLRPPALDELGLLAAIRQAAHQRDDGEGALRVTLHAPETLPPIPAAVEVAVYRIIDEAVTNVVRHAHASGCQIDLSLSEAANLLRLRVADNGCGLPVNAHAGVGMLSMRERAEELGGRWSIESSAERGTVITVELPCALARPEDPPVGQEA